MLIYLVTRLSTSQLIQYDNTITNLFYPVQFTDSYSTNLVLEPYAKKHAGYHSKIQKTNLQNISNTC